MSMIDEAVQSFAKALAQVREVRGDSAAEVRNLHAASRVALQVEVSRLTARYGPEDPRTLRMKSRVQTSADNLRALELVADRAAGGVTVPARDEVVIEGRVTDENGRGLASLAVALTDEKGNRVRQVEPVATARGGYFAVRITGDVAKRLLEAHPGGVFAAVLNEKGKTIQVVDKALTFEPGKTTKLDIVLRRSDFPLDRRTTETQENGDTKGKKSKSK